MEPLESSPWLTLYTEVAKMIDPNEEVVDLGCGTGRFVKLLYEREHYGQVTGVDWSTTALTECERYAKPPAQVWVSDREEVEPLKPEWILSDLSEWRPDGLRAGNTVYVCLEVLEHLADDRELVRRVPPGHRLIFSVPNFDSESHLRVFRNLSEIWKRYGGLVMFRRWVMVGSDRQGVHICETRRRGDSW
jgi:2-polyprenyl-3-methyl-5-hydroxy-6-metoxy-1,4-benzoquinol methylase